jgi:hypothetical protein
MTCDEVELALVVGEGLSPGAKEHLVTCEKCSAFQRDAAQLISDATLPPMSASEKAAAASLAPRVHQAWKAKDNRRGGLRRFAGLAVAACMGAAVASAALVPRMVRQTLPTQQTQQPTTISSEPPEWQVPGFELPSAGADDELDFEVAWPTDTN